MKQRLLIVSILLLFFNCQSDVKSSKHIKTSKTVEVPQKDEVYDRGRSLFLSNCAACHSTEMDKRLTGPALGGITQRREKAWLYSYIRSSSDMLKKGDSIAIELRKQGYALMSSFPHLTNTNIDDILYFIEKKYSSGKKDMNNN